MGKSDINTDFYSLRSYMTPSEGKGLKGTVSVYIYIKYGDCATIKKLSIPMGVPYNRGPF